ncbi:MAG: hypothetical protein V8T86_06290 [Victivallis sp.]
MKIFGIDEMLDWSEEALNPRDCRYWNWLWAALQERCAVIQRNDLQSSIKQMGEPFTPGCPMNFNKIDMLETSLITAAQNYASPDYINDDMIGDQNIWLRSPLYSYNDLCNECGYHFGMYSARWMRPAALKHKMLMLKKLVQMMRYYWDDSNMCGTVENPNIAIHMKRTDPNKITSYPITFHDAITKTTDYYETGFFGFGLMYKYVVANQGNINWSAYGTCEITAKFNRYCYAFDYVLYVISSQCKFNNPGGGWGVNGNYKDNLYPWEPDKKVWELAAGSWPAGERFFYHADMPPEKWPGKRITAPETIRQEAVQYVYADVYGLLDFKKSMTYF